jgi:hypothetical protein
MIKTNEYIINQIFNRKLNKKVDNSQYLNLQEIGGTGFGQ